MKSNIPWSVKGIDPEAREAAKIAARRAGMTLGEWLNSLILQSGEIPEGLAAQLVAEAAAEEHRHTPDHDLEEDGEDVNDLQSRLENLNRRLDASERQSALAVSGIDQSIERLATTIESSRRLLAAGDVSPKVSDLNARVESLQSQLEHIAAQGRTGLDSRTLMALEKAIAGVAGHIEKSDRRNAELVQSVEHAISELTTKVAHAENQASEAIGRVDLTLDRVGSRIDSTEAEQRRSSARLNERLAQMDERLATSLVQRESGIGGVERRLAGLETRLETVQGQIKAQIDDIRSRPLLSPEAFSRKEFEDWSRRQAADQGASQATARQSLANLEARISVLAERAERLQREGGGGQASAAVERMAESARVSSERSDAAAKRMLDASEGLKSEVSELGQRLERSNHTATATMAELASALQTITRRLDALEAHSPEDREDRAVDAIIARATEVPTAPQATRAAEAERKVPSKSPGWLWREEPAAKAPPVEELPPVRHEEEPLVEDYQGAEEVVEVFESTPAEGETEEPPQAYGHDEDRAEPAPGERRDFDWSNLLRNLDTRDRHGEPEAHHPEPEPEPAYEHPDVEEDRGEPVQESQWLEQARRAAKAGGGGTTDRTFEYTGEQDRKGLNRTVKIAIALLLAAAIGILLITMVLPKLLKKGPATTTHTQTRTTPGERPPIVPGTAPNQKPVGNEARNESATNPPTALAAPGGGLTPREDDIGQPLPSEGKSEAQPGAITPPAGTVAPAPATKLTQDEALKAAADAGKPQALYAYALSLKAKSSNEQAVSVMKQAAAKGLAVAERQLGIWYEQGDGVAKDIKEAGTHYLRAAQGGDIQAMHNLGFFFAQGMGDMPKDGTKAEEWFKRAAQHGLVASQVNLAIVYSQADAFGLPPKQDPQEYANLAYYWAGLAAARGDEQAERMRAALAKNIKPDKMAALDKEIQGFKAQSLDLIANGGFDTNAEAFLPPDQQAPLGRDEIISIQEMLNDLGFKAGTPDGRLGPGLETSIKAFQKAYHLPETGVADHNLIAALDVIPH